MSYLSQIWLLLAPLSLFATEDRENLTHNDDERVITQKDTWTLSTTFENDIFSGTDANYTNGVKFSWISPDLTEYTEAGTLPDWMYGIVKVLPFINEPGLQRNVSISLGQNMYTPEDLSETGLIPDDRPYAGWLYLAVGFHNKTEDWMDTIELNAGVVGPASLAEQAQKFVHKIKNAEEPMGWGNQLENEPAINLIWERKYKLFRFDLGSRFGMDNITHFGMSAGTVFTYGNFGTTFRLGWNLPRDFGSATIRMAGDTDAPTSVLDPRFDGRYPLGFHIFIGAEGRAIARDAFLDGNLYRDSHRVEKKNFVGDFATGASIILGRWKLSYTNVTRTRTFKGQDLNKHSFGSINISFSY